MGPLVMAHVAQPFLLWQKEQLNLGSRGHGLGVGLSYSPRQMIVNKLFSRFCRSRHKWVYWSCLFDNTVCPRLARLATEVTRGGAGQPPSGRRHLSLAVTSNSEQAHGGEEYSLNV